ncbi:MAG: Crp/Fnr family transcriptional regulator [Henriciella sp.]|uniref:Crp/Fnr family transcriptional regulator n=1 Tax=Henriciella sp. TaxID=1968823 RepID=UPI0032EEC53A
MKNRTETALERKLAAFVALSADELGVLHKLHGNRRTFRAGTDLVYQGQRDQTVFILAKGWVSSYKLLATGTRQIVDFQIPGDFLGLRSILLHASDHGIEPITDVEVSEISAKELLDIFSENPRLASAVLWAASRDEAMVVEHLIDIGRRSAGERTAHLILELGARLTLVGKGSRAEFDCPLKQHHLADALGLSSIHVNRVLRRLREDGMMTFRNNRVTIDDYERLAAFADFDAAYLDHERPILR